MDAFQVALLTLVALAVGMLVPVLLQLWYTLRRVQVTLGDVQTRIDPVLTEVQTVLAQVRGATQVTSAIAVAVTAGIQAWRETRQHVVPESP